MRKLHVFEHVTLDGHFASHDGDISWFKSHNDPELQAFTEENAKGGGVLLFGRVTYQMMASYWPTPMAVQNDPVVAERMNALEKVVVSRTLDSATWSNTRLIKGDLATAVRKLKAESGSDMLIMGSGTIVSQLTQAGLIDEYQLMVNPVIVGRGRSLFEGVTAPRELELVHHRTFANGIAYLCYRPV